MVNATTLSDDQAAAAVALRRGHGQRPRIPAWDVGLPRTHAKAPAPARVHQLPPPDYASLDDVELLAFAIRADGPAWNEFFSRFRGLILSCALKVATRAGRRLEADELSDVLGEVLLNLVAHDYRRLRLYKIGAGCTVASWIGVIATSTTRDFLRRARRHRLEPTADAELDRYAAPSEGPEDILIDRERRAFVDDSLSGLSARDREFVDRYFLDASPPEIIAAEMGVSLSTVYSKKAKIKARLTRMARDAEAAGV